MTIRQEKPAVNISNLMGGKNEKARLYMKNFVRFIFFLQGTMNGNQNN